MLIAPVPQLAEVLKSKGMQEIEPLPHARVPIVKFKTRDLSGKLVDCDICINNFLACMNTQLLFAYSLTDRFALALCLFIHCDAFASRVQKNDDLDLAFFREVHMASAQTVHVYA